MAVRTLTRDVTPPPPAPPADLPPVDEGPMRRDLLRQIALLDADLAAARAAPAAERTTTLRGPAILATVELERIRDELLAALRGLGR